MTGMQETNFHGLRPIEGKEAHFYTLLNGGDFTPTHLENARHILGAVMLDGHGLVDAQLVDGDIDNPTRRAETLIDHVPTAEELVELAAHSINAKSGPLGKAAA